MRIGRWWWRDRRITASLVGLIWPLCFIITSHAASSILISAIHAFWKGAGWMYRQWHAHVTDLQCLVKLVPTWQFLCKLSSHYLWYTYSVLQVAQATRVLGSQRLEVQKCRGFLELASARVLCLPSVASRVFQTEVMNRVSGMCWNGGSVPEQFQVQVWRWERWRFRVEEFGGMQNVWNVPE